MEQKVTSQKLLGTYNLTDRLRMVKNRHMMLRKNAHLLKIVSKNIPPI
ncbi:hypothetical protein ACMGD3_11945 [Lysinibacillus sphaericus]|nr:hypothetical protein [Lysinibacillus sphaericus]